MLVVAKNICCDKKGLSDFVKNWVKPALYGCFFNLIKEFLPISDMQSMTALGSTLVFFDMETMESDSRNIVQLVAISGEDTFNAYILPEHNIDKPNKSVSSFSFPYTGIQRPIPVTLHKALASFISFLRSLKQPVLLASHSRSSNKFALDRALFRCLLTTQFQQLVSKMLDTLRLSKALFPGLSSYEQEVLSYPFLGNRSYAQNALRRVTDLQELYGCWNPDQESVAQCV